MSSLKLIQEVLEESLQLGGRADSFTESTLLIGSMPELDSMAVVTIITTIEERLDVIVDDDEISAETFESVGSLCDFVDKKLASTQ